MFSKRWLSWLLFAASGLPIAILVTAAVGRLLAAVGDHGGATMLDRLALLGVVGWLVALIGIVVGLAVNQLERPDDEELE